MKKIFVIIFITSFLFQQTMHADRLKTAQSFLLTRPAYDNVQANQFMWRDALGEGNSILRVVPTYQRSIKEEKLARYFLLKCKSEILVAGDDTAANTARDVRAEWLGLPSTFTGNYEIRPEQTQYSVLVSGFYHLKSFNWQWLENSWLGISMPIVGMTNHAHPRQFNTSDTTNPVTGTELIDAFNNTDMIYGKISPCKLSKTTVPELRFVCGTTWTTKNDFLLMYYTGFACPTEGREKPHYLFEPVLGHNRHYAIVAGLSAELPFHEEDAGYEFKMFVLGENNFLIRCHQLRSFDLHGKPWARYMQVREAVTQPDGTVIGSASTMPAANALTIPVRVHPNSYVNFSTGLSFAMCGWNVEVAYQLWAHARERFDMMSSCCEGTPLPYRTVGFAGTGTGSASGSMINTLTPNDAVFTTIDKGQLDILSGTNRAALTQAINGSIGYRGERAFFGIGGFFEKPDCDTALEQWGVWATLGINF